ncbi:MAG: ATP-binding protein [Myxococcota bacterium]
MSRSFLKLITTSVLITWIVGFGILVVHGVSLSWLEDRAQTDAIFLAHELVDAEAPGRREARLDALQPHYEVPLSIMDADDVEALLGRGVQPGEAIPLRVSFREEWYFMALRDDEGVFAVGPVNPMRPKGFVPIGVYLSVICLPLLAGWLAFRLSRQLRKVEEANALLASGELGARVDNPSGPSNELASSFNSMAERIERLIRSREELVQAVSHELGSPLSRLRFHLELIENQTEDERAQRYKAMAREVDSLDELVAELLGYVQSDETRLQRQTFEPQQVVHDLAEIAQLDAPDDSDVEVDVDVGGGVLVHADPRLFQRAVENLLRNAVRYGNGRVRIELHDEGDHVRVSVHDNGPGIPQELREKVLAPFFRQEADRGRSTGGVGLGLAIVNRILQRHDGTLTIDASPLGGAKVEMRWPV